jgi:UDP-glucose:(heptosyl)LPS alpha-1,3-glucosyltransferase
VRVALVIERFEPRGGGVESVAWNVAGALARRGVEVHVLARRGQDHPEAVLHRLAVPSFWQPLRVLAFSRAAARCAAAGDFDVVHAFSRTRHQDVFRAGGGSHADYLARSHGALGARLRRLSPRHAVLLGIERAVFADARQTIQCNSAMVRDELAARHGVPPERLVVIENGVDLARFHPDRREGTGRRLRERLLAAAAGPAWLFAGSGFRRKGLETALRALARGGPSAVLWVAGRDAPGAWRRRAEALGVGSRVEFLGLRDDLADLYAAADALLLPTRYDAFANVCLEALASGLPVVTSGANGAAELVREAGVVVEDPEDVDGFAKALDGLADPAPRAALGRRARALAERHGWDAHAEALCDLYQRIAA